MVTSAIDCILPTAAERGYTKEKLHLERRLLCMVTLTLLDTRRFVLVEGQRK